MVPVIYFGQCLLWEKKSPMLEDYFRQYGLIAMFTALAVILPGTLLVLSWLLSFVRVRPNKPNLVKSSPYECGMNLVGERWPQFNSDSWHLAAFHRKPSFFLLKKKLCLETHTFLSLRKVKSHCSAVQQSRKKLVF